MNSLAIDTALKFHLSLNVNDLDKSVRFLTVLFGSQPMKRHDDYAKFEPDDLPLVLSLVPRRAPGTGGQGIAGKGVLNHLGFRMADAAALVDVQKRLELAGISTLREEGVECCYARQTKFWVRDPDDNVWEIYVLEGDIDHRGAGQPRLNVVERGTRDQQPSVAIACKSGWAPAVWAHRLDEDFPSRLEPNSLDEIFLQGTFNCQQFAPLTADVLRTACEGLRPGGKLIIHALTTDRALDARRVADPQRLGRRCDLRLQPGSFLRPSQRHGQRGRFDRTPHRQRPAFIFRDSKSAKCSWWPGSRSQSLPARPTS